MNWMRSVTATSSASYFVGFWTTVTAWQSARRSL